MSFAPTVGAIGRGTGSQIFRQIRGILPKGFTVGGAFPNITRGGGQALARARTSSTGALPKASNIGKISRAPEGVKSFRLKGRDVAITAGAISGTTALGFLTQTPGGQDFTDKTTETIKTITPAFENITKFAQENSSLLLLLGLGVVVVVLIK